MRYGGQDRAGNTGKGNERNEKKIKVEKERKENGQREMHRRKDERWGVRKEDRD